MVAFVFGAQLLVTWLCPGRERSFTNDLVSSLQSVSDAVSKSHGDDRLMDARARKQRGAS